MFGLGPTELMVILVIALLVLGPGRIPEVASSLGKAIRSFRKATRDLRDQIDIEDEVRRPFEDLRSALRDEPPPLPPPSYVMPPPPAIPPEPAIVPSPFAKPADLASSNDNTPKVDPYPALAKEKASDPPAEKKVDPQ